MVNSNYIFELNIYGKTNIKLNNHSLLNVFFTLDRDYISRKNCKSVLIEIGLPLQVPNNQLYV